MCNALVIHQYTTHQGISTSGAFINPWRACARRLRYLLCVCVCLLVCVYVCEESTALKHRFYDKVSIAADCLLHFQDFQLTELSDVVYFTSWRSFRSSFMVVAIFLNHILIWAIVCGCAAPPLKHMRAHTRQIRYGAYHMPRGVSWICSSC